MQLFNVHIRYVDMCACKCVPHYSKYIKCPPVYASVLVCLCMPEQNALGRSEYVCVFVCLRVFYGVSSPLSRFKSSIQSDLLCVMSSLSAPIQLCSPNHSSMTNCLLGKQKPVCVSVCVWETKMVTGER